MKRGNLSSVKGKRIAPMKTSTGLYRIYNMKNLRLIVNSYRRRSPSLTSSWYIRRSNISTILDCRHYHI